MTDKELDDLFKESFAEHQMPVPPDMWLRIQPQKRKRRVAFWWWTGLGVAALFVLASTTAWFSSTPSDKNVKTVAASATLKKEKTINTQSATNTQSITKSDQPGHLSKPASSDKNIKSSNPSLVKQSDKKQSENHLLSETSERNTRLNRNAADNVLTIPFNKSQKTETDKLVNCNDEQEEEKQVKTDSNTITSNNVITPSAQDVDSVNTATNNTAKKDITGAATPVHVKKIHHEKAAGIELMVAGYESDRNVYDAEKNVRTMFVSLGAINLKEKTILRSASINVRIDKPLTKNLSLKTGLQFLQTHQRVTYNQELVNQSAIINSLDVNSDTTRFAQIHSERPVVKSIYNSINVPLLISYHTSGAKVNIGASAGVLFNLASWYKGEVPDADYKQTIAAKNVFRWNTGASLYLSMSAAKSFGNWQLFAEPHVQYTLSSLTKSTASFKQKITSYGVGIGIKKRIGK